LLRQAKYLKIKNYYVKLLIAGEVEVSTHYLSWPSMLHFRWVDGRIKKIAG